ncbi:hypothetical protein pdam_00013046 [Pocillopora damicornis]|uniref:Cation/H+ exchanger transmembrane domain-containing protein n=1 Tax=Pocillopora damicornis TaxID=46731 RepID=A0A3M6V0S6_POCDA|nr:hypothetical protein pdam_00013046 [Pocillopora damicornis]
MAVFDPEIFFYVLLPPIIFYAGYDMKKRFFFRNIGAILTYAFVGTTISCMVFGGTMYAYTMIDSHHIDKNFDFLECLLFGALISATDPVTVLAIFHDLHVDVDLYALVFGESVMNDAVAIVLFRPLTSQQKQVTKLTKISDFPLLETALFFLLSWTTFLMAEAANLTVMGSVYAELHVEDVKNFEERQKSEIKARLAMTLGRLLNVYPLSFLLNMGRHRKISYKFQHVMVFAGLRGAVAFALAMRNTESVPRQMMLTSVLTVVFVTVIFNGSATMWVLSLLKIRVGVDPEEEDKGSTYVSAETELSFTDEDTVRLASGIVKRGEPPDQIMEGDVELGAVQMTSRA